MFCDVEFENDARAALTPPPPQTVTEWCEENLTLSARSSSSPGKYSTILTPYVVEPLNRTGELGVKSITLCWGVQSAKTTTMMAALAYRIKRKPTPALWAMPSEHLARSFSRDRLQPLIEDCAALAEEKPSDPDRFQTLEMAMRKMNVYLVGTSASNLSSRSCGLVIADEVDKFPEESKREASALRLVELRTRNFPQGMVLKTSTPTLDTGTIWQEYLSGDRRHFMVPCPSCNHQQKLEWEGMRWDQSARLEDGWDFKKVAATAHYVCRACAAPIYEQSKSAMLRGGVWRPENPDAPRGVHSYHLNALYSPWVTWGELAVEFLRDKESPGGLRNFINSTLALPWVPQASTVKSGEIEEVMKASPEYRLGTCPIPDPAVVIMAVDVQQTELWWVVRALASDGSSFLVDYGTAIGWDAIRGIFSQKYPTATGGSVSCQFGLVDSGYAARSIAGVYDFVSSMPRSWAAYKGRTVSQGMRQPVVFQEIMSRDKMIPMYQADDDFWKERLYLQSIQRREAKWHLPRDVRRDYVTQLTGERLVERRGPRGMRTLEWATVGANHLGDCEKMWLVAASEWQRMNQTDPGQDFVIDEETPGSSGA
jgi:phage terminase large subunit GpA-like protein